MSKLEQFIRDHTEMFDDEEPKEGHFSRFEQRLDQLGKEESKRAPLRMWMKIAAGIAILVTAGLVVFELSTYDFSGRSSLQQATLGLPEEIIEVIHVYQNRSNDQMKELNQMAQNCPGSSGLVTRTRGEVDRIDKNMDELVSALKENPENSQVQAALIRNCKAKESYLSDALLQGKMQKCSDNKD